MKKLMISTINVVRDTDLVRKVIVAVNMVGVVRLVLIVVKKKDANLNSVSVMIIK